MEKTAVILAIFVGFIFTSICCTADKYNSLPTSQNNLSLYPKSQYGSYLAGRVAHIRHNLNKAADYYIAASESAPKDQMLPSQLYIMLTSQGRIDEAVKYADQALENNDNSPFIYTIKAVYATKQQRYQESLNTINKCDNSFAREIFIPLINAWNYAGLSQYEKAMQSINKLRNKNGLAHIYLLHAGAISDYMGKDKEAGEYYSALITVMKAVDSDIAGFPLQVMTNFYLRQKNFSKIDYILKSVNIERDPHLKSTIDNIKSAMDTDSTIPSLIDTPSVGLSEALLNTAAILQETKGGSDIALLFASLAAYANPHYDMPAILIGYILDNKNLYNESNRFYSQITIDQPSYLIAQSRMSKNLILLQDYPAAENITRNLIKLYPQDHTLYSNMGEIMRMTKRYRDATIYYQKAIDMYPQKHKEQSWLIYLAQAAAYDALQDNENTERTLRTVMELYPNYLVKNHLGYTLIREGKNIDEAFELIIDAYNEAPNDGSIVDSLGWALYKIGYYEQAVKYLEQASDLSPSEAVIYDHLGDAYWEVGRKNEAVFQWNHALKTKDESGEIDKALIKQKIQKGKKKHQPIIFDKEKIDSMIPQE